MGESYSSHPPLLIAGYYADVETGCQQYHVCLNRENSDLKVSFLCPNGTIFDQEFLTCAWW